MDENTKEQKKAFNTSYKTVQRFRPLILLISYGLITLGGFLKLTTDSLLPDAMIILPLMLLFALAAYSKRIDYLPLYIYSNFLFIPVLYDLSKHNIPLAVQMVIIYNLFLIVMLELFHGFGKKSIENENELFLKDEILDAIILSINKFFKASDLSTVVVPVLEEIAKTSDLDRIIVYQRYTENSRNYQKVLYKWTANNPVAKEEYKDLEYSEGFFNQNLGAWNSLLTRGESINGNQDDFSTGQLDFLTKHKIQAILITPIFIEDKLWGVISFEDTHNKRIWKSTVLDALKTASNVLEASIQNNLYENELELQSDKLQEYYEAIESSSDHIVITDPDGVIVYANKGVEKVTGFPVSEVIGKKAGSAQLWGGQMPYEFYQNLWNTIKKDMKPFTGEVNNRRKNGEQYVAYVSITPIKNEKTNTVKFFVGVERDITREKEIDKAKTEFVSLASHQLRTPLSAVNWYTEMLLNGDMGKLNDKQTEVLKEVAGSNERMNTLVNALLNVSRIDLGTFAIEPEPVNIFLLSDSVVNELKHQVAEKKQNLIRKYEGDELIVNADPNLLRIVIQNLLTNSIKYTPDGGQITLTIKKEDDNVDIEVADNGYGIPEEQKSRIFTKLFRADNIVTKVTEGTGLGLYIVKSIVDESGGKITFMSKENEGTTFFVHLPIVGMKKRVGEKRLSLLSDAQPIKF